MQTSALMEYTGGGRHLKAREQITVGRPSNMRVEAESPFGVALVVVANDSQLAIYDPGHSTIYRGKPTANTLERFVHIPLAPGPATNLLLGLAPGGDSIPPPENVRAQDGEVVVSYKSANGGSNELGFEGDHLAMVRATDSQGQVDYEVRYSDYRDIGGIMLAHSLDASFPATGAKVKFQYQRPIVNGALSDSIFTLTPGMATKEIDLDRPAAANLNNG